MMLKIGGKCKVDSHVHLYSPVSLLDNLVFGAGLLYLFTCQVVLLNCLITELHFKQT